MANLLPGTEFSHAAHHLLPDRVVGMGLSGHHELHRPLGTVQDRHETVPVGQNEQGTLVLGKAPRKTDGQNTGIEHASGFLDPVGGSPLLSFLAGQALPHILHQGRPHRGAEVQEFLVGHRGEVATRFLQVREPGSFSPVSATPETAGRDRIPTGDMHPVGDRTDGHLGLRPSRVEALEQTLADLAVQARHPVDVTTPAHGQEGHVEGLARIGWIATPQCEEVIDGKTRHFGKAPGVTLDKRGLKLVEGGRHRGVRGEYIARPGGTKSDRKGHPVHAGKVRGPGQHRKGGMSLVEVADVDLDP